MSMIHFGSGPDFLTLRIHGRTKPDTDDYWDANWLHCTADASAGVFRGTLEWQIRNEDLARFMRSLEFLDERAGEALLDTSDGWLDVRVIRDDASHVVAQCKLEDNPVGGSTLEFHLILDQAIFPALMNQVRGVLERFPVVGQEDA